MRSYESIYRFFFFIKVINFTCILPGVGSAFLVPIAAIVAKYWMTRLVLTVFPAPDSPLGGDSDILSRAVYVSDLQSYSVICILLT